MREIPHRDAALLKTLAPRRRQECRFVYFFAILPVAETARGVESEGMGNECGWV